MQENVQSYIDAYSNFILNHLLLAENPTGINIIQLTNEPRAITLPSTRGGLFYTDLDYLFEGYHPVKLGDIVLAPSYAISLYFLCTEPKFTTVSADVFFDSYYQLTGSDYLIMTLYSEDNPITTTKLEASSLITCSLNLGLQHDYKLYKSALDLVRKAVIRFYVPQLNLPDSSITGTDPLSAHDNTSDDAALNDVSEPQDLLTTAELDALSHMFNHSDTSKLDKN